MGHIIGFHHITVLLLGLLTAWPSASGQQILIKHDTEHATTVLTEAGKHNFSPVARAHGLAVLKSAASKPLRQEQLHSFLEKARKWPGVQHAEEDLPRYMHRPTEQQQEPGPGTFTDCKSRNVPLASTPVPEYQPYGLTKIQATSQKLTNRTDDKGMVICIIDSGFDLGHPDLAGNSVDGCKYEDSFAPAGCPFKWGQDLVGHGTHVAGTIAAQRNGQGVVGVIPGPAEIYIVRVFNDSGDVNQGQGLVYGSTVILAFTQCEGRLSALQSAYPEKQYRMVVSMSLGAPGPLTIERMYFRDAIKRGDILFVASSGNNGTSPTRYPDGQLSSDINPGNYPGSYPEVIAVAATDCDDKLAPFSQKNPSVDLSAPGYQIMSTASRDDMPAGIMFGGFSSTSDPKITIRGMDSGASQLGASGAGLFSGKVVDCGTGSRPCPEARDSICLVQYNPALKPTKVVEQGPNPSRPPKVDSRAGRNSSGVQQVQGSTMQLTSQLSGIARTAARLLGSRTQPVGQQQTQQQGQSRRQQQGQQQQPRQQQQRQQQSTVPLAPSKFYCDTMEFCMNQDAKAMLIGPASIASGYYGNLQSFGTAGSNIVKQIQQMPMLATFDCGGMECQCWNRIKNKPRLPAAGLTLQQYNKIKNAVAAANTAGKPYTGTIQSANGAYKYLSGTSMAVPHVTGAIARVWATFPNCQADVVRSAFEQTAKDLGQKGKDVQFGYGLVQAEAAYDYLSRQPCAKGPQAGGLDADEKTQLGELD